MTDTQKVKCEYSGTVDSNFTFLELDAEKIDLLLHDIQEGYFTFELSNKSINGTDDEQFHALEFLQGWKEIYLYLDLMRDIVDNSSKYLKQIKNMLGYE